MTQEITCTRCIHCHFEPKPIGGYLLLITGVVLAILAALLGAGQFGGGYMYLGGACVAAAGFILIIVGASLLSSSPRKEPLK